MISEQKARRYSDLETIRNELGIGVTAFCKEIGLPRRNYYEATSGRDTRLSLDQWRRLAEYWLESGRPIEQLLGCAWQDSLRVAEPSGSYSVQKG